MQKSSVVILVLFLLFIGGFFLSQQFKPTQPSPTPTPKIPSPTPHTTLDHIDSIRAGGNSYRDPGGAFVLLYPNDYKMDTQNQGKYVRFSKIGATQQGQTEMYDGVTIVLEVAPLKGQPLTKWVDTRIQESTADGTVEVTQPKKATNLNGYAGFTYEMRGLGTATYIVIQKNASTKDAVIITLAVNDPQKKGFQEEVNAILATVELLK